MLYELSARTTNVTTSNAALEIIGSDVKATKLYEIGLLTTTSATSVFGFGRPAAAGVTPGTTSLFQGDDSDSTAVAKVALTWGTSPTAPSIYMRRLATSSSGAGAIWTFPEGIRMAISGAARSLVLFNITGGAPVDFWAVVGE